MEWDESLETGIPVVDEQHRSLFRQITVLLDHSKTGRVGETLAFLSDYVRVHFGTEESLQKQSRYPGAAGHKATHDAFVAALAELKTEYEIKGEDMLVLMRITKTALDWLQSHIKGADKEFAKHFLKSMGRSALG